MTQIYGLHLETYFQKVCVWSVAWRTRAIGVAGRYWRKRDHCRLRPFPSSRTNSEYRASSSKKLQTMKKHRNALHVLGSFSRLYWRRIDFHFDFIHVSIRRRNQKRLCHFSIQTKHTLRNWAKELHKRRHSGRLNENLNEDQQKKKVKAICSSHMIVFRETTK